MFSGHYICKIAVVIAYKQVHPLHTDVQWLCTNCVIRWSGKAYVLNKICYSCTMASLAIVPSDG